MSTPLPLPLAGSGGACRGRHSHVVGRTVEVNRVARQIGVVAARGRAASMASGGGRVARCGAGAGEAEAVRCEAGGAGRGGGGQRWVIAI